MKTCPHCFCSMNNDERYCPACGYDPSETTENQKFQQAGVEQSLKPKKQWFYMKEKQKHGPVSMSVLLHMFKRRQLTPDTLVWNNGLSKWMSARDAFRKRPVNMTVIAWFGLSLYTIFLLIGFLPPSESPMLSRYTQPDWILLINLAKFSTGIVLCIALLNGHNWARIAFLWFAIVHLPLLLISGIRVSIDLIWLIIASTTLFGDREEAFFVTRSLWY